MEKENILKALAELRKEKKRKFAQTVELIINLKNFDIKKQGVNIVVNVPHKVKERRICAFLNKKSDSRSVHFVGRQALVTTKFSFRRHSFLFSFRVKTLPDIPEKHPVQDKVDD